MRESDSVPTQTTLPCVPRPWLLRLRDDFSHTHAPAAECLLRHFAQGLAARIESERHAADPRASRAARRHGGGSRIETQEEADKVEGLLKLGARIAADIENFGMSRQLHEEWEAFKNNELVLKISGDSLDLSASLEKGVT